MLQSMMFTFSRGRIFFGAFREYSYARVEIILSGNCAATWLTKLMIEPEGDPSRSLMAEHLSHVQGSRLSFWLTDQYVAPGFLAMDFRRLLMVISRTSGFVRHSCVGILLPSLRA